MRTEKARIIVPSNITLLERALADPTGKRSLSFSERVGLATVFPICRKNWTKNSRKDLKAILTKKYTCTSDTDADQLDIVKTRQLHVQRMMRTRAYGLAGAILAPLATWYSFRHYDPHKGQVLPLPFALYGGNLIGRSFGAYITGRWESPLRAVSLGNLPARKFLNETDIAA